jgi:hypothetical protein
MTSFHNNQALKESMVKEIEKHRKADQILQGTYGVENGKWKGCAVACSLRSLDIIQGKETKTQYDNHKRYETDLGIPEWLARLEDTIFENLPTNEALKWPTQFIKAIPVGVDLDPVKWKFGAYLMKENIDRVRALNIPDELKIEVIDAIRKVLAVHQNAIKTGVWDESAARSAETAAWSAAESAWSARSAETAALSAWSTWSTESAGSAARSAAWSTRSDAVSAARSVARSAESAGSAAYQRYAKELLKILKNA